MKIITTDGSTPDEKGKKIAVGMFGNKHTPEQVLLDLLNAGNIKTIVVSYVDNDDYVFTTHSDGMSLVKLGMLDIAKQYFIRSMVEYAEETSDGES